MPPSRGKSWLNKQQHSGKATDPSSEKRRVKCLTILLAVIVLPCLSLSVYHFNHVHLRDGAKIREPGRLVKTDLDYKEILRESSKISNNETHRHYTYPVLAYVTPWNSKGYDMAKLFVRKFTHISPVWYDLKSLGSEIMLEGRHNSDSGWISDIRMRGDALVVPRVVLEANPNKLLNNKKLLTKAIELIVSECREMDYDGIVLESWSRWMAYGILYDPHLRNKALEFIKQLGQTLHSVASRRTNQKLQLIYVIAPPHSQKLQPHDFGPQDLWSLKEEVDGFSLMTYDFSTPQNPGPNSPLKWVQSTLQILLRNDKNVPGFPHDKMLLGLNFYGNDFVLSGDSEGGAITGKDYILLLEKHMPNLQWDSKSAEHLFFYVDDKGSKHVVFYPSLMSLYLRLEEARDGGTGISIWEIGQGLDYFFHLL